MPKTNIHIESSVRKTGRGYEAVHGFVDLESRKSQHHDIAKMVDYRLSSEDVELLRKAGVTEDHI